MEKDKILSLEKLARLQLDDDGRKKLVAEIEEVIEYFNVLKELDTNGIEPFSDTSGLKNVLRSDEVKPSLSRLDIISNAETENGMFAVPVSIEGEG